MTEIPLTRTAVSDEKELGVRRAVQNAQGFGENAQLAVESDTEELTALLSIPSVAGNIYTLPAKISLDTVRDFIERHLEEREKGEGLLMIDRDHLGSICAYHDFQFWPQWASCELGGAIRPDLQGKGRGGRGAAIAFEWLFESIGVELICETSALDNVRTASLLERIGFQFMGEITSLLPDGGSRPSHYWELYKEDWLKARDSHAAIK